eukprot:m51a1_g3866 hypothetical protein (563) ;mRNA; r:425037-427177
MASAPTDFLSYYRLAASAVVGAVMISLVLRPLRLHVRGRHVLTLDYGTAPLLACAALLAGFVLTPRGAAAGLRGTESIQPYTIVVIFFGLAYMAVSFDHTGIFECAALWAVRASGASARKLFFWFWVVSSLVTLLASNDVSILTVTPIVCHFTRKMHLDPTPYLLTQFMASNIWSMFLEIGNPTNIIVGVAYRMTFLGYSAWMALPAAVCGIVNFVILGIIFWKKLPSTINAPLDSIDPVSAIRDRPGAVFGSVMLTLVIGLLCASTWIRVELWVVCGSFALVYLARDLLSDLVFRKCCRSRDPYHDRIRLDVMISESEPASDSDELPGSLRPVQRPDDGDQPAAEPPEDPEPAVQQRSLLSQEQQPQPQSQQQQQQGRQGRVERACQAVVFVWKTYLPTVSAVMEKMPWRILPFVLGMFMFVQCLKDVGWVRMAARSLSYISKGTVSSVFISGFVTCAAALVMNNQPMTILFTMIIKDVYFVANAEVTKAWMFGLVLGSNLCANFTVFGALAGIMWMTILNNHGIEIKESTFSKYGFIVMPVVTAVGCGVIAAELMLFPSS